MKGISAELRDPRKDEKWWPALHALDPCQTVPTMLDGDRVLTDSPPIIEYLEQRVAVDDGMADDRAEALEYVRLADRVCDTLIDLGQHYYPANEPARSKMLGRIQGALDYIARKIEQRGPYEYLVGDRWSLAEIAIITLGGWFPGFARTRSHARNSEVDRRPRLDRPARARSVDERTPDPPRRRRAPALKWVVALALLAGCARPAPKPPPAVHATAIDHALASKYLAELDAAMTADHGQLWGRSLAGPIVFVDPPTREVVANRPDPTFIADGKLFAGHWPADETIANTSLEWHGVRWTMVMWGALDDEDARDRVKLLAHESFHREQPALGLDASNGELCTHLDEQAARVTMQLEWNALEAALGDETTRKTAIADALAFRARRRAQFAHAADREVALEISEGLAEYTGARIAKLSNDDVIHMVDARRRAETTGFVRSFAYVSGPLYGYLLDASGSDWRKHLTKTSDLGAALNIAPAAAPDATRYDGVALEASEEVRAEKRAAQLAEWRRDLVDSPVLIVDLKSMKSGSFDPRKVYPFGEGQTVYTSRTLIGDWGKLEVEDGAILEDHTTNEGRLKLGAKGWHIELTKGWSMQPGARAGDTRVAPDR